jgi:hypothetical protein
MQKRASILAIIGNNKTRGAGVSQMTRGGYDYGFIPPLKKQALIGLNGARKPTPLLPPNRGMKIGH